MIKINETPRYMNIDKLKGTIISIKWLTTDLIINTDSHMLLLKKRIFTCRRLMLCCGLRVVVKERSKIEVERL